MAGNHGISGNCMRTVVQNDINKMASFLKELLSNKKINLKKKLQTG